MSDKITRRDFIHDVSVASLGLTLGSSLASSAVVARPATGNYYPPTFRNFTLERISCEQADNYGIFAEGHEVSRLRNIRFRDVEIKKAGVARFIRFADNIELENVINNGEKQPVFPPETPLSEEKLKTGW